MQNLYYKDHSSVIKFDVKGKIMEVADRRLLKKEQNARYKKNPDINLKKARNKKGIVIAEAMIANECTLCGREFHKAALAITSLLPRFTTEGCIGIKFFESGTVIFDFDKHRFYF